MTNKPYIIGITGGSASGKTLFLKSLLNSFAENEICLISQDNYYKPRAEQPVDNNGIHNFDTPFSIDFEQYCADIRSLRSGKTVIKKEYTFNNPNIVPKTLVFQPSPIIVVEGIFVFYFPEVASLLDLKVFIDAKEHIKLRRRIIRDKDERGYDLDDVLYRYENHVAPTYEKYIKPFMGDADIVIPNNNKFDAGLDVLVAFLKNKISIYQHDQ
jgi:uridine kinase